MQNKWTWLVGPLLLLAIWWVATTAHLIRPIFLPPPADVGTALRAMLVSKDAPLVAGLLVTLTRILTGLVLGVLIGLPTGLVLGYFARAYDAFQVPLDFFRSIPVTALFPFFLLLFGIGDTCKVAIATWAVALIMAINTIYGVRACNPVRAKYLRSIGARPWQTMLYQVIPEAAPSIIGGLRISISQAFIVVIVTEMIFGADRGLGYMLYGASLLYKTDEVVGLIIVTGLLGYGVNKLAERIGKRVVFWQ